MGRALSLVYYHSGEGGFGTASRLFQKGKKMAQLTAEFILRFAFVSIFGSDGRSVFLPKPPINIAKQVEVLRFRPWIRLRSRISTLFGTIPIPYPDRGKGGFGTAIEVL